MRAVWEKVPGDLLCYARNPYPPGTTGTVRSMVVVVSQRERGRHLPETLVGYAISFPYWRRRSYQPPARVEYPTPVWVAQAEAAAAKRPSQAARAAAASPFPRQATALPPASATRQTGPRGVASAASPASETIYPGRSLQTTAAPGTAAPGLSAAARASRHSNQRSDHRSPCARHKLKNSRRGL